MYVSGVGVGGYDYSPGLDGVLIERLVYMLMDAGWTYSVVGVVVSTSDCQWQEPGSNPVVAIYIFPHISLPRRVVPLQLSIESIEHVKIIFENFSKKCLIAFLVPLRNRVAPLCVMPPAVKMFCVLSVCHVTLWLGGRVAGGRVTRARKPL